MTLNYVEPVIKDGERVIALDKEDIDRETLKWKQALVLYVMGDSPGIGAIDRFVATNWNFASKPKIYYHNDGYFVVKFSSIEDRDVVLCSGPYTIGNKSVILKLWAEDFNFTTEVL